MYPLPREITVSFSTLRRTCLLFMSLTPRAAQAKLLRLQRRAAERRVLHLVPRVGLCFTGDYSGLGGAFRTEGWSKEGSKWFFCGRANQENQRQIRLILAWAKGNGEQVTAKQTEPRRFYSDEQLRVQGFTTPPTSEPTALRLSVDPEGATWGGPRPLYASLPGQGVSSAVFGRTELDLVDLGAT